LSIDGSMLLYMDYYVFKQVGTFEYRNIDVDIRQFADGKKHTIRLNYYNDAIGDTAAVIVDYLRFIKDESLHGNSDNIHWPDYSFCGGACRSDLLAEDKCVQPCDIIECQYDRGMCHKKSEKTIFCYNGYKPGAMPDVDFCKIYSEKSCCVNNYDSSFIASRIAEFKNNGCFISSNCLLNIERAICSFCSPESNRIILNGTMQFTPKFRDGLYSSCSSSHVKNNGKCVLIEDLYDSTTFLNLFGQVSDDADHSFGDLAYDPTVITIIIVVCVVAAVVIAGIVAAIIVSVVIKSKKNNNKPAEVFATAELETVEQPQPPVIMEDSTSSITNMQVFQ